MEPAPPRTRPPTRSPTLAGYSKSTAWGSVPKTRVGTAAYISPEVARCRGDVAYDTEKADAWSCGVTLYCMLAGRYPFTDADNQIRCVRYALQRAHPCLPAAPHLAVPCSLSRTRARAPITPLD